MGKRIKNVLIVLAVVLGALGLDAGAQAIAAQAAGAATHSSTRATTNCRLDVEYNLTTSGTPQGGATQWVTSCGYQQRVRIKCWSQLTNQITGYDGGWVYSTSIQSGQNCHHIGEELVKFGWQARIAAGNPITRTWIWTRPGFSDNPGVKLASADTGTAATVVAHISRIGPGPHIIKTLNANVCVKASPDEPNTSVIQGDYGTGDCRKVFFVLEGHINGFQYGEWETRSRNAIVSPTCSDVSLAPEHSTGSVWVIFLSGTATQQLVSRHCDTTHDCLEVLAATGNIGQHWLVINKRENPGFFTNLHIIQTSAGSRTSRAGC